MIFIGGKRHTGKTSRLVAQVHEKPLSSWLVIVSWSDENPSRYPCKSVYIGDYIQQQQNKEIDLNDYDYIALDEMYPSFSIEKLQTCKFQKLLPWSNITHVVTQHVEKTQQWLEKNFMMNE